ncbi:MAG: hypothetical protein HUU15_19450 [Candidatus Brocadiae bacterium]|nr:hypothetical protein [Candidatus Brocadiia bacterium]
MRSLALVLIALHFVGTVLTGAATFCSAANGSAGWSMEGCWCDAHEHGDAARVDDHGDCGSTDLEPHPVCGVCRHSMAAPPVGVPALLSALPALPEGEAGIVVESHPSPPSWGPVRSHAPAALLIPLRC